MGGFRFFWPSIFVLSWASFENRKHRLCGGVLGADATFGMVLALPDWRVLASRLHAAEVVFVIPPSVRFESEPGEQWTIFFRDPSINPIEFNDFADLDRVFASH